MAEKKRFLDVWIVELNAVYREVPFAVVADWLQQGRLLGDDRVRPAGTDKWYAIGKVPTLSAFLPQADPFRAEDQAEAMEPVETGFHWRRRHEEDDDDVDMIPLIDISLVLLIFFMMTAAVSSDVLSAIKTPDASQHVGEINKGMFWVGIDIKDQHGKTVKDERGQPRPWYSLGQDLQLLHAPTEDLSAVRSSLRDLLTKEQGSVKIRIRADQTLPIEVIKGATLEIQGLASSKLTIEILGEVSDAKNQ